MSIIIYFFSEMDMNNHRFNYGFFHIRDDSMKNLMCYINP